MKEEPTFGHGKICYIEIPAKNPQISADFFEKVFGWRIRDNGDGSFSFDDGVGEVSGMWVENRQPHIHAGIMISIMVDDAAATSDQIVANGGTIIKPLGYQPVKTALFADPAGNMWTIYQHGE